MNQKFYKLPHPKNTMETATKADVQMILNKLAWLQKKMEYMQEYIEDTKLTEEEKELLNQSVKNEKDGTLTSLNELKNVRNKTR